MVGKSKKENAEPKKAVTSNEEGKGKQKRAEDAVAKAADDSAAVQDENQEIPTKQKASNAKLVTRKKTGKAGEAMAGDDVDVEKRNPDVSEEVAPRGRRGGKKTAVEVSDVNEKAAGDDASEKKSSKAKKAVGTSGKSKKATEERDVSPDIQGGGAVRRAPRAAAARAAKTMREAITAEDAEAGGRKKGRKKKEDSESDTDDKEQSDGTHIEQDIPWDAVSIKRHRVDDRRLLYRIEWGDDGDGAWVTAKQMIDGNILVGFTYMMNTIIVNEGAHSS